MKKITSSLIIVCALIAVARLNAQTISTQLSEASATYKSGDLQGTRFALQQALAGVDKAIGAEILLVLPKTMGKMEADLKNDNITAGGTGFAGLLVSRSYKAVEKAEANLLLMADSPLLSGINAMLSLPTFVSDPNQKKVRIGTYRAMLNKNSDESGSVSWSLQIPFGSSLVTFDCKGAGDEKSVLDMANTIPFDKISKWLQ